MSSLQTVFARTVTHHLPNTIPTHLERIDEFGLGKVLVYSKRPFRLMPWRKRELDFTGYSLSTLLDESSCAKLEIKTSESVMFDVGSGTSTAELTVDLNMDEDLSKAVDAIHFGGDAHLKSDYHRKVTIAADFGKITHVAAQDLLEKFSSSTCPVKVNSQHPIVQRAIENGSTLFVILAMYTAERCIISTGLDKKEHEEGKAEVDKTSGGGDITDAKTSKNVCSRPGATPLAFLAMRITIGADGQLQAQLNNKLVGHHVTKCKGKHDLSSLVPLWRQALGPGQVPKLVVATVDEWVIIKFESSGDQQVENEGRGESEQASSPSAGERGGAAGLVAEPSSPEHREIVQSMEGEEVATKVEANITYAVSQVNTPFITPFSEIPISKPPGTGAGPAVKDNETDAPAPPDHHYIYSLKDFQAFHSSTYQGIMAEVEEWVQPVTSHKPLRDAFFSYLQPPRMLEKLNKLSDFLQKYGDALRMHHALPTAPDDAIGGVLATIDEADKLDQVTSLIIITEAILEFPQHIVKATLTLAANKRKALLDLIKSTPYGTDKHLYLTEGPINDPDLYPIMTRMGFSLPARSSHLIYTAPDDSEDDILAAGLILLEATAP